jgi:large-conductance mechanosensitive channel
VLAIFLNACLQALQVGAYAARLAGVKTGRIGTSISLFNLLVTVSRFANMFYAPILGSIGDQAAKVLGTHHALSHVEAVQFEWQMRVIVFGGTFGTIVGALLLPAFVYLFVRGVASFERRGSIPHSLTRLFDWRVWRDVLAVAKPPTLTELREFKLKHLPLKLLIGNVVVTGIQAIAIVASYYASILQPEVTRTALSASGLVNGIATIAFATIVDPTSALLVDQAVKGERPVSEIRSMVFYLALTFIIGTLISQLILFPAAIYIGDAAKLINPGH